ncbi:hypothetical protein BC938DRAFT_473289 [Jimgerdemannia flammicorona]|uniref:Uncharacterized protein n=1 Tax=Jimgerdemannia flammicorona TaxID=994334 RepID=A0A433Q4C6_9FUNG|nr:hypothetical protein BC938DRAFT_475414 [Jimgerdemannia flammicorona]RUS24640.1 hypothetical protein BC938DRAFT_473289 [Jimgerdemannia flammicorona]
MQLHRDEQVDGEYMNSEQVSGEQVDGEQPTSPRAKRAQLQQRLRRNCQPKASSGLDGGLKLEHIKVLPPAKKNDFTKQSLETLLGFQPLSISTMKPRHISKAFEYHTAPWLT